MYIDIYVYRYIYRERGGGKEGGTVFSTPIIFLLSLSSLYIPLLSFLQC